MEGWYRRFLLILATSMYCLIPVELVLSGHTEGFLQWIPFIVCAVALASLLGWGVLRSRWSYHLLKASMAVTCASSLVGAYQHYLHNLELELEIRPGSVWTDVFAEAISGASPLLAPGILFLAGLLVLAALRQWPMGGTAKLDEMSG